MMKIKNFQHAKNLRFLSMKKIVLFAVLLIALMFISSCATVEEVELEETKTSIVKDEPTQETKVTTPEKEETTPAPAKKTKTTAPYCGDKMCNNDETCDSCSLDCGTCTLEISAVRCWQDKDDYNVKITFKNINTFNIELEGYPRAIFSDAGVFDGLTKTISVPPFGTKAYTYSFKLGQLSDSVKLTLMSDGKELSNEFTVECEEE